MNKTILLLFSILFVPGIAFTQTEITSIPLANNSDLIDVNVISSIQEYEGKESLKILETEADSEVRFVKINNLNFADGSIEAEIVGKLAEGANKQARGFVGIAFRINDDNSKFECIYLRPSNARAEDQVRRNHSVQYISYPDFPWYKMRQDYPKKYETYVDLVPGEYTKVRIEINGEKARLFVHGNDQPTLIINDLKHGADMQGCIGLWIGPGTEAYFSNLQVTIKD